MTPAADRRYIDTHRVNRGDIAEQVLEAALFTDTVHQNYADPLGRPAIRRDTRPFSLHIRDRTTSGWWRAKVVADRLQSRH
jgi:hypothetical protein